MENILSRKERARVNRGTGRLLGVLVVAGVQLFALLHMQKNVLFGDDAKKMTDKGRKL